MSQKKNDNTWYIEDSGFQYIRKMADIMGDGSDYFANYKDDVVFEDKRHNLTITQHISMSKKHATTIINGVFFDKGGLEIDETTPKIVRERTLDTLEKVGFNNFIHFILSDFPEFKQYIKNADELFGRSLLGIGFFDFK